MRGYIVRAQQFEPVIPSDLHNYIVAKYVEKRKLQREGLDEQSYMYVTPRTLLAIIRLSQALARLSFRDIVNQQDVDEAIKLMDFSIRSLRTLKSETAGSKGGGRNAAKGANRGDDRMSDIIRAVRNAIQASKQESLKVNEILKAIGKESIGSLSDLRKEELTSVLKHYQKLSIIYIDESENVLFI
jgi:DNA replication licensing factor MCM7